MLDVFDLEVIIGKQYLKQSLKFFFSYFPSLISKVCSHNRILTLKNTVLSRLPGRRLHGESVKCGTRLRGGDSRKCHVTRTL